MTRRAAESSELPTPLTLTLSVEGLEAIADRVCEVIETRRGEGPGRGPSARVSREGEGVGHYLTVAEAANYLRAKPQRVYDLLSARRLTRFKDGRRVLVSRAELEAYLAGTAPSAIAPALPHTPQSRMGSGPRR